MKNIIIGIKNLWKFRKVVWDFRPYDYSFNLDLLIESLKLTSPHLRNGITLSGPDDADNIDRFIELHHFINTGSDFDKEQEYWDEAMDILKNEMTGWWE